MKELWYEHWFASIQGISSRKKREIREKIIYTELIYNIEESDTKLLEKCGINEKEKACIKSSRDIKNWKHDYKRMEEDGIRLVVFDDPLYPTHLKEFKDRPYALYVKGRLPDDDKKSVAIVGARNCTPYGKTMTLKIAEELAKYGVQIISGMALGIDGAAHRGAINVDGETFAVLGCGVDICYPKTHRGLYKDLIQYGGILSEYPPGVQPLAYNFPARNRIISALSDCVLVMEAKEKSGSLITTDFALEQGKDIYALPGPVESELSRGCNELIRQGAGIITGVKELMEDLDLFSPSLKIMGSEKNIKEKIMLESEELMVYGKLCLYPKSKQEILDLTGLSPQKLSIILITLELKGYISEISKDYYIRQK